MVFNSYTFIVFLMIMLVLHNLPFPWKVKKINLLLASYIFYAAWNPPFILLLWLSTVVDYFVGKALYTQTNIHKKRVLLVISLIGNLGMLCFFKYGGFLLDNFVHVVNALGVNYHPAKPNIILPAGISFYTFTTLCYTIDMYRRESKPVKSLLDFSLFVTFFPHLVAGPIVRPPQLVPQFETARTATKKQLLEGLFLLSLGLFMKVVLADSMLSVSADAIFNSPGRLPALDAWMGVLAFSGQIFFDFAGYSTCAIGAALCLGFILPQNFAFPYAAIGFSDFWRRWHITLSAWLRDYLYIPLGGNRVGWTRAAINLVIVMFLGGLWHGAAWTFVVWGLLHGSYLVIEHASRALIGERAWTENFAVKLLLGLVTYGAVCLAWVFFRASDFTIATRMLRGMFGGHPHGDAILATREMLQIGIVTFFMMLAHWSLRETNFETAVTRLPRWIVTTAWALMACAIILTQGSSNAFIYFQF